MPMQRTIGSRRRDVSALDHIFAELHGTFRLQLRAALDQKSSFLLDEREIVTLAWPAPWAVSALRHADYYELECSFKALKPHVYSIPIAVKANVGIPLGIVIARGQGGMFFQFRGRPDGETFFTARSLRATAQV
jgi:hypothetical protein